MIENPPNIISLLASVFFLNSPNMQHISTLLILLIPMIFFWSCSKKNRVEKPLPVQAQLSAEEKIQQIAQENFKENYSLLYNESRSKVCIYKAWKTRPSDIEETISFLVFDPEKEEIIFKKTHPKAKIRWVSEAELEVQITPGRIRTPGQGKQRILYNAQNKSVKNR